MTRLRVALLAFAVFAFALTFVLGACVSFHAPYAFDLSELGVYGMATPLAKFLTSAGRFPTYFALSCIAIAFGLLRRAWLGRAIVSVVGLTAVWQTSDLLKLIFHRPRPLHPIVAESSFGFPSGHADLALYFYGFWAYWMWHSTLPRVYRFTLTALATLLIVGIGWSRLALGAHFPGDVAGGYLFGAGWLALALLISSDARVRSSS